MNIKIADLHGHLNLIAVIILFVGLTSAILIYQTADNDSHSVLGYQVINGIAYPIMADNSKIYRRDLEIYGGKMAVLADEFRRWFIGLWQGKSLAFTVACITIFISVAVFIVANRTLSDLKSNVCSDNSEDGTG